MLQFSRDLFLSLTAQATTIIYTLSLHDALPISCTTLGFGSTTSRKSGVVWTSRARSIASAGLRRRRRSEEHTSELQSRPQLVCRLLLEKKKVQINSMLRMQMIIRLTRRRHDPML